LRVVIEDFNGTDGRTPQASGDRRSPHLENRTTDVNGMSTQKSFD